MRRLPCRRLDRPDGPRHEPQHLPLLGARPMDKRQHLSARSQELPTRSQHPAGCDASSPTPPASLLVPAPAPAPAPTPCSGFVTSVLLAPASLEAAPPVAASRCGVHRRQQVRMASQHTTPNVFATSTSSIHIKPRAPFRTEPKEPGGDAPAPPEADRRANDPNTTCKMTSRTTNRTYTTRTSATATTLSTWSTTGRAWSSFCSTSNT